MCPWALAFSPSPSRPMATNPFNLTPAQLQPLPGGGAGAQLSGTSPSHRVASLLWRPHECRQRVVPTTTSRQRHCCPEASTRVSLKRSNQHAPSPWVPAEAWARGRRAIRQGRGVPGEARLHGT